MFETYLIWIWWKIMTSEVWFYKLKKNWSSNFKAYGKYMYPYYLFSFIFHSFLSSSLVNVPLTSQNYTLSSPCTSPVSSAEHQSSATVCSFSAPVKFFISHVFSAMRLQSTEFVFNVSVLLLWPLHFVRNQLDMCAVFSFY